MTGLPDGALGRLRTAVSAPEVPGARYTLGDVLGEGGMGTVYRARDEVLDREVAVKVARTPSGPGSAALAERLRTEARVLARLEHPGIVPVHDAGLLGDGRVFYVMKLVRGQTLARALDRLPALDRRLGILERIAEAVAFAHQRGVVHRDLKPDNIMVGDFGEVLVMDWGVAKILGRAETSPPGPPGAGPGQTDPGTVLGTPGFMPPEQARGSSGPVDPRADVYALGALLAYLLTERYPSLAEPPAALLEAAGEVPRRLRAIATRCLAPAAGDRYPDAGAVAEEIRRFRAGSPVLAYREGWLERAGQAIRTYRTPILLVVAYLAMRVVVALLGR